MTARERWKADLDRYVAYSHDPRAPLRRLRIILTTEGVWAIWMYRFGQYLLREAPGPVRILFRVPYEIARRLLTLAIGIHIDPNTQIGPGLYIAHFGGIWINPRVTIGSNCNIAHGATLGAPLTARNAPMIGDRVWIGSGAVVTGPVRIGSGVVIGANSLVTCSLPDNAVAVGVPARVIAYSGSANLIRLPNATIRQAED